MDGLRGLAVLLVALSHCSNPRSDIHLLPFLNFSALGQSGVYLFFLLSSYLLDRQIALAIINKFDNLKYWLNYFLRRFLRIYPLFFVTLIVNSLLWTNNFKYSIPITSYDIIPHLLLRQAEGIYWSIPVEFKYYFLSPILMLCMNFTQWKLNRIITLFICLIAITAYISVSFDFEKISILKFLPIFLVGSLLSILDLLWIERKFKLSERIFKVIDFSGVLCLILILVLAGSYYYDLIFQTKYIFNLVRNNFTIQALLFAVILISAKYGNGGIIKRFMEFKPLRFIGVISFSFYLFHMPVLKFFRRANLDDSTSIILFILITCVISSISYLLIELPLSKIKLQYRK